MKKTNTAHFGKTCWRCKQIINEENPSDGDCYTSNPPQYAHAICPAPDVCENCGHAKAQHRDDGICLSLAKESKQFSWPPCDCLAYRPPTPPEPDGLIERDTTDFVLDKYATDEIIAQAIAADRLKRADVDTRAVEEFVERASPIMYRKGWGIAAELMRSVAEEMKR